MDAADLKRYALSTLPTLRKHLEQAEIAEEMALLAWRLKRVSRRLGYLESFLCEDEEFGDNGFAVNGDIHGRGRNVRLICERSRNCSARLRTTGAQRQATAVSRPTQIGPPA